MGRRIRPVRTRAVARRSRLPRSRLKEAEKRFRLAIAHHPIPSLVRRLYTAYYLLPTGRQSEALEQTESALQEDPLDSVLRFYRGVSLASLRCNEEAFQEFHAILELNPNVVPAHAWLGFHHLTRGSWTRRSFILKGLHSRATGFPNIGALAGLLKRIEKAFDQGDPAALTMLRLWQAELFSTPHWARSMRKLNLPEAD
jgi:tetratricopeptide (TPR) repeat protein